jgi:type II restriction enzyme
MDEAKLHELHFFELSHDELPDILAYTETKNWLFLIEAVHSAGPMSEIRVHELKKLLAECAADLIFVTAFLTREDFRKWSTDIAWETEVWIADNPDHLIHFNGSKFLGPYGVTQYTMGCSHK